MWLTSLAFLWQVETFTRKETGWTSQSSLVDGSSGSWLTWPLPLSLSWASFACTGIWPAVFLMSLACPNKVFLPSLSWAVNRGVMNSFPWSLFIFVFASWGKAIYCFGIAFSPFYRPNSICPCCIILHFFKSFYDTDNLANSICFWRKILWLSLNCKEF